MPFFEGATQRWACGWRHCAVPGEWPLRTDMAPHTASAPDTKGRVYASSNTSECLVRVEPLD